MLFRVTSRSPTVIFTTQMALVFVVCVTLVLGVAGDISELGVRLADLSSEDVFLDRSALNRSLSHSLFKRRAVGHCPLENGYRSYHHRCLKLYTISLDYHAAQTHCKADGGHLFHFKSRHFDGEPFLLLMKANGKYFDSNLYLWVGADDIVREGHFFWSDGTRLPKDSDLWTKGQPDEYNYSENCVEIHFTKELDLNDIYCSYKREFVCQINIGFY